jgi:cyclophilin family peptidyl-prolyl cis-trans isomerase
MRFFRILVLTALITCVARYGTAAIAEVDDGDVPVELTEAESSTGYGDDSDEPWQLTRSVAESVHGGLPGTEHELPRSDDGRVRRDAAPHAGRRGRFHQAHLAATGEHVSRVHAHRWNSIPAVATLQMTAPPLVRFKRRNFGLRRRVTHLANITVHVGGTPAGSLLMGLYGDDAPAATANFIRLATTGALKGSRCVRTAPSYAAQCGDMGPVNDASFRVLRSISSLGDGAGLVDVGGDALAADRKALRVGTVAMVATGSAPGEAGFVPRQAGALRPVGSHFVLVASSEAAAFNADPRFVAFGHILSGFTSTLLRRMLQHVPTDADARGPREGSAVTFDDAWVRPFPRAAILDALHRDLTAPAEGDDGAGRSGAPGHAGCDDVNLSRLAVEASDASAAVPWLFDVPAHVTARYYLASPDADPEVQRKARARLMRDKVDNTKGRGERRGKSKKPGSREKPAQDPRRHGSRFPGTDKDRDGVPDPRMTRRMRRSVSRTPPSGVDLTPPEEDRQPGQDNDPDTEAD